LINWIISGCSKFPKHYRIAGYEPETGDVYLAAGIFGNETAVLLCACHDGVSAVYFKRHCYLPASWLMQEYSENYSDILTAVKIVRDIALKVGG
jgi:hypothetical protein